MTSGNWSLEYPSWSPQQVTCDNVTSQNNHLEIAVGKLGNIASFQSKVLTLEQPAWLSLLLHWETPQDGNGSDHQDADPYSPHLACLQSVLSLQLGSICFQLRSTCLQCIHALIWCPEQLALNPVSRLMLICQPPHLFDISVEVFHLPVAARESQAHL